MKPKWEEDTKAGDAGSDACGEPGEGAGDDSHGHQEDEEDSSVIESDNAPEVIWPISRVRKCYVSLTMYGWRGQ